MKQSDWQRFIFNSCIGLNCLLLFLLLAGDQMRIPAFLQVFGRAHPLALHFPIVLLLLAFLSEIFIFSSSQPVQKNIADWLLLSASFTTAITALMGLFLSKEPGYEGEAIVIHKWLGVSCSLFSFVWFIFRNGIRRKKALTFTTGACATLVLLFTGHVGGNITHGEGFLLSPMMPKTELPAVPFEEAVIYTHLVQPILEKKCMNCHNLNKSKGELAMETQQLLLKGGKDGKLWDTTAADMGLMMQRIHLPSENKEHMPPTGKPQLTDEEIRILYLWIKGGASFTKKLTELPPADSLRVIASSFFQSGNEVLYDFPAASEQAIQQLNTAYRVIAPIATASPALDVSFFSAAQYKSGQLKELEKIKNNIVSLQLSKMPVTDEDLKIIGGFSNLRTLNLAFTNIKGEGLQYLAPLQHLQQLSLSGTGVTVNQLKPLAQLKKLKTVELWNTAVTEKDQAVLKAGFPAASFDLGFTGDTVLAQVSDPVIDASSEKRTFKNNISLTLKSRIKGAQMRYTLDGTDPDSIHSAVYKEPLTLHQSATVKVKAYLKGWISSSITSASFYKSSITPDSIFLLTKPNPSFVENALEGKALIDGITAAALTSSLPEWVGFRENPFEAELYFNNPVTVTSVIFSALINSDAYIMPPEEIQVWGGDSKESLKLLSKITPAQPAPKTVPFSTGYDCNFPARQVKVLKLVAKPVAHLPAWHRGKGDKGWIFLDEILLN